MRSLKPFLTDAVHDAGRPLRGIRSHLVKICASLFFGFEWMGLNHHFPFIGEGYDSEGASLIASILFWMWIFQVFKQEEKKLGEGERLNSFEIIAAKLLTAACGIVGGRFLFTILPPWDNGIGTIIGVCANGFFVEPLLNKGRGRFVQHRGPVVMTRAEARATIQSLPRGNEPRIEWAGFSLPGELAAGNFLCVGEIGTGKTRMHRELMTSVLPNIRAGSDRRALIYDVKTDALAELEAMKITCDLIVMNPYDRRSWGWDMAADITSKSDAVNFAEAFIPESTGTDKIFFTEAARAIVAGVINKLNDRIPGKWTLRDIVRVTATKPRLAKLLAGTDLIEQYFSPDETFANVRNNIANVTTKLEAIAALWEHTTRKVSMKNWVKTGDSVMVLAGQTGDAGRQHINRVMCKIITAAFMNGPESPNRSRFWFFCDELKEAGQLDSLEILLNGRSKGVRCVLGFQDLEGLIVAYKSTEKVKEMASRCSSVSWLKLSSTDTAKWASDRCGDVEKFEYLEVTTKDGTNVGEHLTKRESILPSEFLHLPYFTDGAVAGIHIVKSVSGIFKSTAHYQFPNIVASQNYIERDFSEQELAPWTDADDQRLKTGDDPEAPSKSVDDPGPQGPDLDDIGRIEFT